MTARSSNRNPAGRRRRLHCAGGGAFALEPMEIRRLFAAPPLPVIPGNSFDVTTYGAAGDNATDNTAAIQNALNAAHTANGGTINIPSGAYLSGPLTLYNNIELHL